jgi:diaminohydroxyphosphoribosylaminopyrimidine deaminase/5-amino-6-(5-phosphoribosylamino)uracil reductase
LSKPSSRKAPWGRRRGGDRSGSDPTDYVAPLTDEVVPLDDEVAPLDEQARVDEAHMALAVQLAQTVRTKTSPNPWVGCVIVDGSGEIVGEGATSAYGGPHAETAALAAAGHRARDATAYVTLEPCAHQGKTPPCTDALIAAGVSKVVVGIRDPDPKVAGAGLQALKAAGVAVSTGTLAGVVSDQLRPYLVQRSTGRPFVVLKLAVTLDGRTAAPDGSSRWITGAEARRDVHRLRAESDAVLVGAGTVRHDDPELTARDDDPELAVWDDAVAGDDYRTGGAPGDGGGPEGERRQPLRVVLGHAPEGARVLPALELQGELGAVLDELGRRRILQVLVEGGAHVAAQFHREGLVDRYVWYVAPVFLGGDDGRPVFAGSGVATMAEAWRGRIILVRRLGVDLRVDVEPEAAGRGRGLEADR